MEEGPEEGLDESLKKALGGHQEKLQNKNDKQLRQRLDCWPSQLKMQWGLCSTSHLHGVRKRVSNMTQH